MLKRIVFIIVFLLLCSGTLFLCSDNFVNIQTTPKWYCFYFSVPLLVGLYSSYSFVLKKNNRLINKLVFLSIIPVCCFLQSLYGIGQYSGYCQSFNGFRVTGSFDNPAGFAASLCAGAAFCFYFIFGKNRWIKWTAIVLLSIIGIAIFLSASRAGMVSFVTILILAGFHFLHIRRKRKIILSIVVLVTLITGLYFLKKDSADGRILIWQCSWEMIKDKPLLGFGPGGFKAHYMNYQAGYFEAHPDSPFNMLADNINRPFNEYVLLLVNFGLVGWVSFLAFVLFLWKLYRNNPNKSLLTSIACWCLSGIALFALFSYPLTYPFVWVMGLVSIYIIINPSRFVYRISHKVYKVGIPMVIIFVSMTYYYSYTQMQVEKKWCKIAHESLMGQTEKMLPQYASLYKQLHHNEFPFKIQTNLDNYFY